MKLLKPRPCLQQQPVDPSHDFRAVWARLERQWDLPLDPLAELTLTVADLRIAAGELFSCGLVHGAAVSQHFVEILGEAPDRSLTRLGS